VWLGYRSTIDESFSEPIGIVMAAQNSVESLLEANERSLLEPGLRKSGLVTELVSDSFVEFGSSGRIFTREQIVAALMEESPIEVSASGFSVRLLAPGVALVTYCTKRHTQPPVVAIRS
jgi:hypothetical protein